MILYRGKQRNSQIYKTIEPQMLALNFIKREGAYPNTYWRIENQGIHPGFAFHLARGRNLQHITYVYYPNLLKLLASFGAKVENVNDPIFQLLNGGSPKFGIDNFAELCFEAQVSADDIKRRVGLYMDEIKDVSLPWLISQCNHQALRKRMRRGHLRWAGPALMLIMEEKLGDAQEALMKLELEDFAYTLEQYEESEKIRAAMLRYSGN